MSIPSEETVKCPKCGEDMHFTYWRAIKTDMDFAIPDIISGKLFEVKCKKCGYETHVKYPILFDDMIHDVIINYVMPVSVEDADKVADFICARMGSFRLRVVTDQADLREKTAIFNAGLDDRVIELQKLIIMSQIYDQVLDKGVCGVYFVPGDKPVIEIRMKDGSTHVPVDMNIYRALERKMQPRLVKNNEYHIDQSWAARFLTSSGNKQ